LRRGRELLRHLHQPKLRIVGTLHLAVAVERAAKRIFHVRLARAEPHIAQSKIGRARAAVASADAQLQALTRVPRREVRLPPPTGVRLRGMGLVGEGDHHHSARHGRSAQQHRLAALDHGMVAELRIDGRSRKRAGRERAGEDQ